MSEPTDSSLSPEVSAAIEKARKLLKDITPPPWAWSPRPVSELADLLLRVERERIRLEQELNRANMLHDATCFTRPRLEAAEARVAELTQQVQQLTEARDEAIAQLIRCRAASMTPVGNIMREQGSLYRLASGSGETEKSEKK